MPRLLIISEGFEAHALELRMGVNRFGRTADNHFQITHPTVSSRHCEIEVSASEITLRDCGSTNGTFVNGFRIQPCTLSEGQVLRVDNADLRVAIPVFDTSSPTPPVVLSDGSLECPRHPQALVTHQCTHCREVMCDTCVRQMRRRGAKLVKLCPLCSHPVKRLQHGDVKRHSFLDFLKTVRLPFGTHKASDD